MPQEQKLSSGLIVLDYGEATRESVLSNFVSYGNYESNYRAICQFLKAWEVSTAVQHAKPILSAISFPLS